MFLPDGMTLFATVCNTTRNMAPYALWMASGGNEYLVDLSDVLHEGKDIGLTGLTFHDGKLYLAVQSPSSPRILVFDRNINCIETITHPDFIDIHSLHNDNGALIVVSTGNQSIIEIDMKGRTMTTLYKTDKKIHPNSAFRDKTGLLVCCQSPRHLFPTVDRGGVIDVTNQRVVMDGLGFPHSLEPSGTDFIVLDSNGERVIRFNLEGIVQQQALSGFLRGVTTGAGCIFVASSVGRIISRKNPEAVSTRVSWDALGERVCIYELDERSLSIRTKHYPLVAGFEIYELLALDRGTKVEPRGGRLLPPDQYSIGRAFYEAAKNVAAGGPK